jgi:hypothetical protein
MVLLLLPDRPAGGVKRHVMILRGNREDPKFSGLELSVVSSATANCEL